ncbi:MAG: ATP-binding cassette domain-containing protein, partial [Rhizobiaceae bacterium]
AGLSGGQKQRIGLARAFYGNPQIMVLDEPNANLDEDGEAALHRALLVAKQADVTIAIITQRTQALAVVDKVLRMHAGSKDFFGTRDEFVQALQKMRAAKNPQPGAPANAPTAANNGANQPTTSRPANVPDAQPKAGVPDRTNNPYSFGTQAPVVVQGGKTDPKKSN